MSACSAKTFAAPTGMPMPTPTMSPTPLSPTSLPLASPTPALPSYWEEALPGLLVREMVIPASGKSDEARAVVVRLDPQRFLIRVIYQPDQPRQVSAWRQSSGALVTINGGFFQADHTTAGLIISAGDASGVSFDQTIGPETAPGMFSVTNGVPNIRDLNERAYDPKIDELDEAVQGFPILIRDGAPGQFTLPDRVAWRTVVGLDSKGNVYLINISRGEVSLVRLGNWLSNESGLGLTAALNLDGGPSSGMVIHAGNVSAALDSISSVPSVIAVFPR